MLNNRLAIWNSFPQPWDIIIVGGGITGAGLLRCAAAAGLRALLLEAGDFSCGTSSRSSKMVHGGFRYLRNRQYNVTYESVRERQHLLSAAPHLVTPLRFLMPYYHPATGRNLHLGVIAYDLMAPRWDHCAYTAAQVQEQVPVRSQGLLGGYEYTDARVDDSRLVLRILQEATSSGASAINYTKVTGLLRTRAGQVCGVVAEDQLGDFPPSEVQARVIVNAAGPFSDELRAHVGALPRIRKLRGSHLVFPGDRLPLTKAVTLFNPRDNRAMFALPWEGTIIFGTTDIDHQQDTIEPYASSAEIDYLLDAACLTFPALELSEQDVISTFSGLRPIVSSGQANNPSKESRAHVILQEDGLLTITGGKLTTYRIMAQQALEVVRTRFPQRPQFQAPGFDSLPVCDLPDGVDQDMLLYLAGRYGQHTPALLAAAREREYELIEGTPNIWAELRWAARCEAVEHLDDILLRRVRLGLLLPGGGQEHMHRIRSIIQSELEWSDQRWQAEETRYFSVWESFYAPMPNGKLTTPQGKFHLQYA